MRAWLSIGLVPLLGCTLVAGSGDFRVVEDAGTDTVPVECMTDEECVVANGEGECADGLCTIVSCEGSFDDCDARFDTGCEADTNSSLDHCGACNDRCDVPSASESCVVGDCQIDACQMGFNDCNGILDDGCEARLDSPATCGDCFNTCDAATPVCDARAEPFTCVESCPDTAELCEGSCVDTENDPLHCGGCDACPTAPRSTPTCEAGSCGLECETGFGDCTDEAGCETDITMSLDHCGGCDQPCAGGNATWACTGSCEIVTCDAGFGDCNDDPADGCEQDLNSTDHCGTCDAVCTESCVDGFCDPVTNVDGYADHTCAVRQSGRLECWGINWRGEMGDGTNTARPNPNVVLNPDTSMPLLVDDVAVGFQHTCAIDDAGEIWCWGSGTYGALATPLSISNVPVEAIGDAAFTARTFTQIEAKQWTTCALDDTQRVWCWGRNDLGQLGIGTSGNLTQDTPTRVAGLDVDVAEIAVGGSHACARLVDATVRCWGFNASGVGDGTTNPATSAVDVGLSDIASIAAGNGHSCAATTAGVLYCWGSNTFNQLGLVPVDSVLSPTRVDAITNVSGLSAGSGHTCALVGGNPRCWGNRGFGELGDGTLSPSSASPVAPLGVPDSAQPFALYLHTCAIDNGRLWCWGDNKHGQLGRESTIVRTQPDLPVMGLTGVESISAGFIHGCAGAAGTAYCWGRADEGQTGTGVRSVSSAVPGALGTGATQVHAVNRGTLLIGLGQAHGFGGNASGRLGNGTTGTLSTPVLVDLAGSEDDIGLGDNHGCARQGTAVYCWGSNASGQLGRGSATPSMDLTPGEAVLSVSDAAGLAVGSAFACVLRSTGQVSCWGENSSAQLGADAPTDSTAPMDVPGVDNAIALSAGHLHACAIQEGGTAGQGQVICWGSNSSGQVGNPGTAGPTAPSAVPGLADAVSIGTYSAHSCAVRVGGSVWCWGRNTNYELGNGTTDDTRTPVQVLGITDGAEMGSGGFDTQTTCAIRTDQTAVCWGACWNGACGTGAPLRRPTPELVRGL